MNLYGFVGNSPLISADHLGLKDITVGKCEAYLYIGHLSEKKPINWDMKHDCSIAGVVGCYPKQNSPKEQENRWPLIPEHPYPILSGPLGEKLREKRAANYEAHQANDGKLVTKEGAEQYFPDAVENALSVAAKDEIFRRLCRVPPACCAKVTFIIEVGKDKPFHGNPIHKTVKAHGYRANKTSRSTEPCP